MPPRPSACRPTAAARRRPRCRPRSAPEGRREPARGWAPAAARPPAPPSPWWRSCAAAPGPRSRLSPAARSPGLLERGDALPEVARHGLAQRQEAHHQALDLALEIVDPDIALDHLGGKI